MLRLNDDGTTPASNPFFQVGARIGGEIGANIQKIFAYGIRNSFGLAFDPLSGALWDPENGPDPSTRSTASPPASTAAGRTSWVRLSRITEFKAIPDQCRVLRPAADSLAARPTSPIRRARRCRVCSCCPAPTTAIRCSRGSSRSRRRASASSPAGRLGRAVRRRPVRRRVAADARRRLPAALQPVRRTGAASAFSDPRLADRVADNAAKFDATESETPSLRYRLRRRDGHPDRAQRQSVRRVDQQRKHLRGSARPLNPARLLIQHAARIRP